MDENLARFVAAPHRLHHPGHLRRGVRQPPDHRSPQRCGEHPHGSQYPQEGSTDGLGDGQVQADRANDPGGRQRRLEGLGGQVREPAHDVHPPDDQEPPNGHDHERRHHPPPPDPCEQGAGPGRHHDRRHEQGDLTPHGSRIDQTRRLHEGHAQRHHDQHREHAPRHRAQHRGCVTAGRRGHKQLWRHPQEQPAERGPHAHHREKQLAGEPHVGFGPHLEPQTPGCDEGKQQHAELGRGPQPGVAPRPAGECHSLIVEQDARSCPGTRLPDERELRSVGERDPEELHG